MIPAETLLEAYSQGMFPMSAEDGDIRWYEADPRTILDIHHYHLPHDLRRILNRGHFIMRCDTAFEQVIRACADRASTWISDEIISSYINLHKLGYAHSVETWMRVDGSESGAKGKLVGGLYGVAIGAAFFGESMFYRASHASKAALAHLVAHLQERGFELHDAQMMTSTLKLFGAHQIPREEYLMRLQKAIKKKRKF